MPASRSLGALAILLALLSCGKDPAASPPRPLYGGTLKLAVSDPVESLDPQSIRYDTDWFVASMIFEGLTAPGSLPDSVEPLLAESWTRMDGGARWLVRLRSGVRFQDAPCFPEGKGREVTADDIVFTFTQALRRDSTNISPGPIAARIASVRALDRNTAEFTLTRPYVTFLKLLSTPPAFIIPHESAGIYGRKTSVHPVGTGPFRLAVWENSGDIILVRNPSYWRRDSLGRDLPYVDEISIRLTGNPALCIPLFLKGETHFLVVNESEIRQLRSGSGASFMVTTVPEGLTVRFFGISMDPHSALGRRPALRRALAASYNRSALIRVLKGVALEASTLAPPHLIGTTAAGTVPRPDPSRFPQGDPLPAQLTISTTIRSPDVDRLAAAVKDLGMTPVLNVKVDEYYEHVVRERPDLFRVSMQPLFPDPEEYYAFFSSKSPASVNLTGYRSAAYDSVFDQSTIEQDSGRRRLLFRRLESILQRDAPLVLLTHEGPRHFVVPGFVRGLVLRFTTPDFALIWLDRHEDAR